MAEANVRDAKLIQYLGEAYGKEKELETALQAHISMAERDSYKKRLRQHLKETKGHARLVERRIKKLGGGGQTVAQLAGRAMATAKGPLHALRGASESEKQLKNAKTEYWNEAEEIANYTAIEALAETVGDAETAKVARQIRREEERMARFLERLIPTLTKEVARTEIPADERRRSGRSQRRRSNARRSSSSGRRSSSSGGRASSSGRRRSASKRSGKARRR